MKLFLIKKLMGETNAIKRFLYKDVKNKKSL